MSPVKERGVRVRCVRAVVAGRYGWLIRWIDYDQPVWRQQVFVPHEAEARALVKALRVRRRQSSKPLPCSGGLDSEAAAG